MEVMIHHLHHQLHHQHYDQLHQYLLVFGISNFDWGLSYMNGFFGICHWSWGLSNMSWFCHGVCHHIYTAHLAKSKKKIGEGVVEGGHDAGDECGDGGDDSPPPSSRLSLPS